MRPAESTLRTSRRSDLQRRLTYYVIPVLIGVGGVVFSQQFDSRLWRYTTLLISIALPLYAAGNLIARYNTSRLERLAMLSGVLMLILGAAASVNGFSGVLPKTFEGFEKIVEFSRLLGAGSLFLGLFVVLFSVVRTGEDTEEMASRFLQLAEHIQDGFILSTPEGLILLVNDHFVDMFGMRREDFIGKDTKEFAQRFDIVPISEHLKNRALGVASEYEVTVRVDGREKVLLFNGAPVFNKLGKHTATIATVRDITEQVRLTQRVEQYAKGLQQLVEEQTRKLEASEERFRDLLLTMNEGFLTVDLNNHIHFVNAQMEVLLRRNRDELVGQDIFEFVDYASRSRLLNLLALAADPKEKGLRQEIEFIDSEDRVVPTVVAGAYITGSEEEDRGYSLVVTGIADIKRMQQKLAIRARELERANEELRMHDRAKDSFLSNVSHELRTPLSTIQGYVELFDSGSLGAISETQANAVKVMERNVERLLALINEMIEFSRMQIRGIQLVFNLFRPDVLIHEAAAAIHPDALEKELSVEISEADAPPFIWGDREKMVQVLGILLNNAVKFTPKKGTISIKIASDQDHGILFSVSDSGIGIAPAYHDKIFDRFFQVDSSKTRQYEGTGIGLSIAKNIIDSHGGHIQVQSELNQGTTFLITLPRAAFGGIEEKEEETMRGLTSLKLLVASERPEVADALRNQIGKFFAEIEWIAGGYQCMRRAAEYQPDLIIINESSSDVLGLSSLRLLRQNEEIQQIPVLVMTMENDAAVREAQSQYEQAAFLVKPLKAADILETIQRLCLTPEEAPVRDYLASFNEQTTGKRYAFVIDQDPGLLEWVATALKYRDVGCVCMTTAQAALDMANTMRPDVIFIDGDAPGTHLTDSIRLFHESETTRNTPVYMMTGLGKAVLPGDGVAGILRKPFNIRDLVDIVSSTGAPA